MLRLGHLRAAGLVVAYLIGTHGLPPVVGLHAAAPVWGSGTAELRLSDAWRLARHLDVLLAQAGFLPMRVATVRGRDRRGPAGDGVCPASCRGCGPDDPMHRSELLTVGREGGGWVSLSLVLDRFRRRLGHGVAVLLWVYANCIDGGDDTINDKIGGALG